MEDFKIKTSFSETVVHCGENSFDKWTKELTNRQIYVVTDSNVFAFYRYLIWKTFGERTPVYIIPSGETGKTIRYLSAILKDMLRHYLRRDCTLVAIGGGVVGDLGGLAASLYMRGVNFVQIPTTILAQVDSSIGGKTSIDFEGVKNAIGTFYPPEMVISDPMFLSTLTDREYRCGLGEIIKYGALNSEIFRLLMENIDNLKSDEFLKEISYKCMRFKAKIVEEDEFDRKGIRRTLNLGHTTGHVFESAYHKKSHGEYVLIGMYYEMYIARKLKMGDKDYYNELRKLIRAVVKRIPSFDEIQTIGDLAKLDKKNDNDEDITLIVPESEGKCTELKIEFFDYKDYLTNCSNSLPKGKR